MCVCGRGGFGRRRENREGQVLGLDRNSRGGKGGGGFKTVKQKQIQLLRLEICSV